MQILFYVVVLFYHQQDDLANAFIPIARNHVLLEVAYVVASIYL